MGILQSIAQWLQDTLLPYGGIGLMLIAVCDSSFVSLPEVNDILLMTFSIDDPSSMVRLAAMTTAGSIIGCALLYSVGRKGGETLLRRRFGSNPNLEAQLVRIRGWYSRYGILAIVVPSLLPPPTPFKIFVLSAGAFGISWPKFLAAVGVGRGIRYFSEGILAVIYGPAAIVFVRENYGKIGIVVAAFIVAGVLVFILARRRARGMEA